MLPAIVQNGLAGKRDQHVCFVEVQKAFDDINCDMLLYKVGVTGIDGEAFNSVNSIHTWTMNVIGLNGYLFYYQYIFDIHSHSWLI